MVIVCSIRGAWSTGGPTGRLALAQTFFRLAAVSRAWSTEVCACIVKLQCHHAYETAVMCANNDHRTAYNLTSRLDDSAALSSLYNIMQKGVFSDYLDFGRHSTIRRHYKALKEALPGQQVQRETSAQVFHRLTRG